MSRSSSFVSFFGEEAACVIIREDAWRRRPSPEYTTVDRPNGRECLPYWRDQLLYFLGRALILTRRFLYILLCVDPSRCDASHPSGPAAAACKAEGSQTTYSDDAAPLCCGQEAWQLCVWLSGQLGHLARGLELPASPLILPWYTGGSAAENESSEGPQEGCCHWLRRARLAVLRHYLVTSGESMRWLFKNGATLSQAIPLILDEGLAFTDSKMCSLWPRHWRLKVDYPAVPAADRKNTQTGFTDGSQHSTAPNENASQEVDEKQPVRPFRCTLVAGTFDRLHAGHRLLLAAAAFATSGAAGLAVAAGPLVSKKGSSLTGLSTADIEPFAYRLRVATAFMQLAGAARNRSLWVSGYPEAVHEEHMAAGEASNEDVSHSTEDFQERLLLNSELFSEKQSTGQAMQLQIFRITDAVGPADRLEFDCLVVSAETLKAAHAVNAKRMQLGNHPVSLLAVQVVPLCARINSVLAAALRAALPHTWRPQAPPTSLSHNDSVCQQTALQQHQGVERSAAAAVCTAAAASSGAVQSGLSKGNAAPSAAEGAATQTKVSSTELRQQQWRQLRCDSISWLCSRFLAAWLWLSRNQGESAEFTRRSSEGFWRLLCAEHATPWRRLHTFSRVARLLRRLEEFQLRAQTEPVVLCVFLESLLACPCHYVALTVAACDASDCSSSKLTSISWSPDIEGESWQRAARGVLAHLCAASPQAAQPCAPAETERQSLEEFLKQLYEAEDSIFTVQGSFLKALLAAQRTASLANVASGLYVDEQSGRVTPADSMPLERAEAVEAVRRLELQECTDGGVSLLTRMQQLREEYFFLDEFRFQQCRAAQLKRVLDAGDTLQSLTQEERLLATATIKQELEILACVLRSEASSVS
ncbi:hypothetical protein Efla_002904 [Eimeria flavescens]